MLICLFKWFWSDQSFWNGDPDDNAELEDDEVDDEFEEIDESWWAVLNDADVSDEAALMLSYSSWLLLSDEDLTDFLEPSIESIEKNPFDLDFSLEELLASSVGLDLELLLLSSDWAETATVVAVMVRESFIFWVCVCVFYVVFTLSFFLYSNNFVLICKSEKKKK